MHEEKKVANVYCVCNIKVAAFDPDKVERNGRRFHKNCLRTRVPAFVQAHPAYREQAAFIFAD